MFVARSKSMLLSLLLLAAAGLAGTARAQDSQPTAPGNTAGEVALETAPASTVLVLPVTGSFDQHPAAIEQLMTVAGPTGMAQGPLFGVYYSDPETTPEAELSWAVGVPVAAGATAEPPLEVRDLPERQVAAVLCTGPYETTHPCYAALLTWLEANALQPAGPFEEHWLSDPMATPPEAIQTRIVVPVAPR